MNFKNYLATSLDYMYYRTARAYYKWDGKQGITAVFGVALFISALSCFSCLAFGRLLFGKTIFLQYKTLFESVIVGVSLLILFFTFKRYLNSFDNLHERFKDESEFTRKWKGLIVVVFYILPWVILIIT